MTQTENEPTIFDQLPIYIRILISLLPVILLFGLLEFVAYRWERKTAAESTGWTLVASRRMPVTQHGTTDAFYTLLEPNADYTWEGIPVHINSRGLRSEEVATPKPTDTYRILNLGDSVVFGWEVRQEESYGQLLEQSLNAAVDGQQYEVINAGVPGWTVDAERNFLLQEGFGYEPDLVLLDLTIVNDVYAHNTAVPDTGLFDWLRDHTYTWPFLTTQIRFLLARQVGPEAIPVLNPPHEVTAYYPITADHPAWDKLWNIVLEIHAATQAKNIPLVIVAFPTAFQLNSAHHPDVPQQTLRQRAEAAGIPFIDLLPIYQQACNAASPDAASPDAADPGACEGYENLLFADVWMHPNALGHELATEAILPMISASR